MTRKEYILEYQKNWIRKRRTAFFEGKCCVKCDSAFDLEADHIDPSKKEINISQLWSCCEEKRSKELAKCQVLCKLCHRKKSNKEISRPLTHSLTGYHRGCRCDICKKAHSIEMKDYHNKTRKIEGCQSLA